MWCLQLPLTSQSTLNLGLIRCPSHQYSLGEERSYLWTITKDSITSYQLPPRSEIETAAKAFLSQTTYRDAAFGEILPASNQLTQLILPNLAHLSQKRLLIVPDGQLHYIPFSALSINPSDYQPLLTKHQVIHLPSASTVAINRNQLTQRTTAPNTLAIIAFLGYTVFTFNGAG